jgi:methionyl-tRNA synthetase
MIGRYFDGEVPAPGAAGAEEAQVLDAARNLHESAGAAMAGCQFHTYLDCIAALTTETNRFIEVTAPFKLAKDPAQRERLGAILYTCAEAVRLILLYLQPVMPNKSPAGLAQLGWSAEAGKTLDELGAWGVLAGGTKINKGDALFPRMQ